MYGNYIKNVTVMNKSLYRFQKFSSIVTSFVEFEYLRQVKKLNDRKLGVWTREKLITMGPTFVKIGQFMSTRTDILGEDITEELKLLQDNISPLPFNVLKPYIVLDQDKYTFIDANPIASASIGQVHLGCLRENNKMVVLKIKRPFIEEQIINDFDMLLFGIGFLKQISNDRKINEFELLFNEYYKLLKEEIDFQRETNNMIVFNDMFKDKHWVKIPKVYPEYCNHDVIVMEYAPSIKIDNITALDKMNFDKEKVAQKLIELFVKQIIIYGVVHIDPHPGNVGITEQGNIVFYDFGMILNLDDNIKEKFKSFLIAVYDKDVEAVCKAVVDMGLIVIEPKNIPYFKFFLVSFLSYIENADIEQFKISYIDKLNSYSTPFVISSKFILLLRGISILEGVCKKLDPNFNFKKTLDPYIDEFIIDINYFESKAITDITSITKIPDNVQINKLQIDLLETTVRDVEKKVTQEQTNHYLTIMAFLFILVMQHEFDLGIATIFVLGLTYTFILNGKIHL